MVGVHSKTRFGVVMDQEQLQFWFRASVVINGGTLAAVMVYGYKIVRFFNRVEFQMGLLWRDYLRRTDQLDEESINGDYPRD